MAYIGNSPENIQRGKRFVYEFKATAGQTVFSGTDLNNQTLDLLEENEMGVYLNGVRLADSDDYTVSGDTLTLISAASLNDQLTVETQAEIANISSYTRAEADARYINYDGDIVAGDLQISGEVDAGSLIVDTDVLVVDATNDIVGIGTATPSTTASGYEGGTLHIHNAGTGSSIRLTNSTTGTGTSAGMLISKWNDSKTYFTNFDDGADMVFTPTNSGGSLVANTLVIKSDGKIGIGTASPVYQLHVNSGATNIVADFESTDGIAGIRLRDNSGNTELSASGNDFRVQPAGGTPAFAVTGSGNVGIGTTSPAFGASGFGLEVKGTGRPTVRIAESTNGNAVQLSAIDGAAILESRSAGMDLVFGTSGVEKMRIDDTTGNVGIGTDAPDKVLDIRGDAEDIGNIHAVVTIQDERAYNSTRPGGGIAFRAKYNSSGAYTNMAAIQGIKENTNDANYSSAMLFTTRTSGSTMTEKMRITSAGYVGIGTNSPDEKLHVNGLVKAKTNNYHEGVVVKEGSTGSFTFTQTELNPGSGDNIAYFIMVSVYRPTNDITNDVASLLLHGVMPRGSSSSFSTVSTKLGSGISSLTATNSINSLVISTDSGTNFRCAVKVIAMGGTV